MKQIPVAKGAFALVDDEDYERLIPYKWALSKGYATRNARIDGNKQKTILMHREINKTPIGTETDHIDGNRLNNQKANLRNATRSQNLANSKSRKGGSKHKGVCRYRTGWRAQIQVKQRQLYLGDYNNEIQAALAYNVAAFAYFGKFAKYNKI